jgi:O-antigen/teichoic acid export membrane protein
MRIEHSLKNILMGITTQIVITLLGFISRKVFIDNLGSAYLGVNGLLTNVLSMMVLIEGGIAISIVYNLYKPLSEGKKDQIIALVQLYKKAYSVLAVIVLLFSLGLYPYLGHLMKDGESISNLTIIYSLFVGKSVVSYLNAHKWSLINADQRGYLLGKVNLGINITTMIGKIIILVETKNYVLFLLIEFLLFLLQNIINGRIVNKRYPYIKTKEKYPLDPVTKQNIIKNVKAMFLQNIGGYLVFGTDNILISSLISVATVGLYSNYTMLTQQLAALIDPILGGIGSSVGNLIATDDSSKNLKVFHVSFLVNFWLYSMCTVCLYVLMNPFISWWLGSQNLLDHTAFIFILVNFYINGMRTAIATFKNKAGLFTQDKYFPLIEGGVNLVLSLLLVKYFGLAGIFMGTTVSTFATIFWTQPCIVFKNLFKKSVWPYFIKYGYFLLLTVGMAFLVERICSALIINNSLISLFLKGCLALIIINVFYVLLFFKSPEFQYLYQVMSMLMKSKLSFQKKMEAS